MNPSVTAIFVTYNSADTIAEALGSFQESHERGLARCVVVDNASQDRSLDTVRGFPWVNLVPSDSNLGYGSALNLGMRRTDTEFIAFMNADACLSRRSLEVLVEFLKAHPKAAMVGPAIVWGNDNRLQETGGLPTPWRDLVAAIGRPARLLRRKVIEPGGAPFRTDWLCGAVLLARASAIEEVGGFDEAFFLYYEETDLCRRLLDRGWELWAVGEAQASHVGGASATTSGEETIYKSVIAKHFYASRFRYLAKHHGYAAAAFVEAFELLCLGAKDLLSWPLGRYRGRLASRLKGPVFGRGGS